MPVSVLPSIQQVPYHLLYSLAHLGFPAKRTLQGAVTLADDEGDSRRGARFIRVERKLSDYIGDDR